MSCSITTRVGWCTWSTFCEGPSSGPGVVLDCRLGVEGGRRTRLRGSRHRCSGSGGLACGDHVACRDGEAGCWLRTESRQLLWCRGVELSSWGARGTMRAAMTSSRTTARTRREAFSKGEGAPRGCSFGRLGLLAPHNAPARGWRHRRCRPGVLESPGKSMGEAAAPGSPWGIPGSSRRLPWIPGLRRLPPPAPLKLALASTAQPPRAFFSEPLGTAQSPVLVFRGGEKLSEAAWRPSCLRVRSQLGSAAIIVEGRLCCAR